MKSTKEEITGYVADLACLRKYSSEEALERASVHTTECSLMGHCIESGYGLVDDKGRIHPLDSQATQKVVKTLKECGVEKGVKLKVTREKENKEMVTKTVELI